MMYICTCNIQQIWKTWSTQLNMLNSGNSVQPQGKFLTNRGFNLIKYLHSTTRSWASNEQSLVNLRDGYSALVTCYIRAPGMLWGGFILSLALPLLSLLCLENSRGNRIEFPQESCGTDLLIGMGIIIIIIIITTTMLIIIIIIIIIINVKINVALSENASRTRYTIKIKLKLRKWVLKKKSF